MIQTKFQTSDSGVTIFKAIHLDFVPFSWFYTINPVCFGGQDMKKAMLYHASR
jgi:hypothetical protein